MTAEESRNVEAVERWAELYNTDPARMVTECYASDCEVVLNTGLRWRGHAAFLAIEQAILDVAPKRRAKVMHVIPRNDRVVVQGVLTDPAKGPEWRSPFCAVLTFADGLITKDETYLDPTTWPALGLDARRLLELGVELPPR